MLRLILMLMFVEVFMCGQQRLESQPSDFFLGTRYYESGEFEKALFHFDLVLADSHQVHSRDPQFMVKVGYCHYRTGQHREALQIFSSVRDELPEISDYLELVMIRTWLGLGQIQPALDALATFNDRYAKSPLHAEVDSLSAHLYFQEKQWANAQKKFEKMAKSRRFNRGDVYHSLILTGVAQKKYLYAQKYAFNLIRKYPFHAHSDAAYQLIRSAYPDKLVPQSKLNHLFRYLTKTERFSQAEALLAEQIRLGGETEQIRWLKIRMDYLKRNYWIAFQACQKQRSSFKNAIYRRHIDLHIARCYLRLGSTDKAIEAYSTFQKRYPSDAIAAEVLWVVAWLCEEQGRIAQARSFYQQLLRTYSRSEFVDEAKFRIGLSYYREDNFEVARFKWQEAASLEKSTPWKQRYDYWINKTHEKEENYIEFLKGLQELAARPFDSYYNLKSFLMITRAEDLQQASDSLLWEMHYQQASYLPDYVDEFKRPLMVQDIFGDRQAQMELNQMSIRLKQPSWELLFAVGEVNERLQNYGRAYRIYRQVYDKKFSQKDWKAWLFLFKRLYPLYFDAEVHQYAQKWGLTPASIWAIIKKESAFESQIMSYANAYGLMQIIPPTASRLTESLGMELEDVRQLYDPNLNILLGSYYLSNLMERYDGNLYQALAAYNAGEHRVDRWRKTIDVSDDDFFMENIEFEQTRTYVRRVMEFYWTYHLLIKPHEIPNFLSPFPFELAEKQELDRQKSTLPKTN